MATNTNIWETLPKPFFVLAPMENVTDTVFRQIISSCGKPDVFFTEFTNTDGMCSIGRKEVEKRLLHTEKELPLIAQIWGTNPDHFYETAKIISKLGFDGIDINMGCPVKDVMQHGSCAALIDNPSLASEIIKATQLGAGHTSTNSTRIPVSVKTRIGTKTIKTEEWISHLLTHNLAALTIHGRTAKEQSLVPAHWDEIAKAVLIRDQMTVETKIIGNGDVETLQEAKEKAQQYGVDGVMIGRGVFKNLWVFNPHLTPEQITMEMRLEKLLEHITLFQDTWGDKKPFPLLKKFVKAYVHSFDGAAEMRASLMETSSLEEMKTQTQRLLL